MKIWFEPEPDFFTSIWSSVQIFSDQIWKQSDQAFKCPDLILTDLFETSKNIFVPLTTSTKSGEINLSQL